MNILQSHEIYEISGGGGQELSVSGSIGQILWQMPYKYGQNLCDYYTGWDQVTGWNGPALISNQLPHPTAD